jgi:hypothetical protein
MDRTMCTLGSIARIAKIARNQKIPAIFGNPGNFGNRVVEKQVGYKEVGPSHFPMAR